MKIDNQIKELKVSVIIPNFNGEALLEKNLPKVIDAKNYQPNNIDEIIIVDDGSSDNSVSLIKQKFPQVRLIKHKNNRGFLAAVNTGVRMAKGELVVLLNSDVVPEREFLSFAIPHFADEKIFAVSLKEKGYGWAKGVFKDGFILHEPGQSTDMAHNTFWVNGGSGVFRRREWNKMGGMDEKLMSPFYWEDIDLSYRAAKRGYRLLWEPKAKVVHDHESTIGKLPKRYVNKIKERNQLIFIWKNVTSSNLRRRHVIGLFKRIVKHPGYIRIFLAALWKYPDIRRSRKKEIKEEKVCDEAIFERFISTR